LRVLNWKTGSLYNLSFGKTEILSINMAIALPTLQSDLGDRRTDKDGFGKGRSQFFSRHGRFHDPRFGLILVIVLQQLGSIFRNIRKQFRVKLKALAVVKKTLVICCDKITQ
jgi:hypothetical protein